MQDNRYLVYDRRITITIGCEYVYSDIKRNNSFVAISLLCIARKINKRNGTNKKKDILIRYSLTDICWRLNGIIYDKTKK